MLNEDFLAPRACLLLPLPEHAAAADLLSSAADAILAGDLTQAGDLARLADMPALFDFASRVMGVEDPSIHRRRPIAPPTVQPTKVADRMPSPAETRAVFERDGWRCRFCGCRVVSSLARRAMRACLPDAIPWSKTEGFHGAFYALTASVDHVLPHAAGGGNDPVNLVTACWPCQFGRNAWTIEEVGLIDPRSRAPVLDDWDGLGRLLDRVTRATILQTTLGSVAGDVSVEEEQPVAYTIGGPGRTLSSDQARWLTTLDEIQLPPSRRIRDFLERCADLGVSWSLNKVLLARMRVGTSTVEFLGINPNGEVNIPWSLGGQKEEFRAFAEILANGIPDALCYETPKLWNVSGPRKKPLGLIVLLDAQTVLRSALEALHAALSQSSRY